jgi:hypothetical protein
LQSIYYILWRFAWQEQILKKNAGKFFGTEYAEVLLYDPENLS